jgi:transcriptional regulator with XRE-family HTH domain
MLHLPQNVRLARLVSGKTQSDFGAMFGASKAMIISYEKGKANPDELFISRLSRYTGISENDLKKKVLKEDDFTSIKKVEKVEKEHKEQSTQAYEAPPIWQIVLNLTYIGKKDSDSMNTMAATNQRNTDIIAALVSTLLPNSGLAEKLTASLAGSHTPDDLPVEHFVGGTDALKDALSKQQQAGKEKVKHK